MRIIACAAPYGKEGLGQHLAQVVEEARGQGILANYYCTAVKPDDAAGQAVSTRMAAWLAQYTVLRLSPGWQGYLVRATFDRNVAWRLTPAESFQGFSGQAFNSLSRARQLGYKTLLLESGSVHVNQVFRQQEKAYRQFGLERGWLNEAQRRKTLSEYDLADTVVVTSQLSRETFLEEGIAPDKLQLRKLQVDKRFTPPVPRTDDGIFRIVYVGGLTVMKGIPILLEAFARLKRQDAQLTLVGGWGSRPMRQYLQGWLRRDPRIRIVPGDPLPHLQSADVYVHPSFTDAFGYAPMEALACGVPTIVTEDTGMKEYVREGINGYVVPTGSWEAILERLELLAKSGKSLTMS